MNKCAETYETRRQKNVSVRDIFNFLDDQINVFRNIERKTNMYLDSLLNLFYNF